MRPYYDHAGVTIFHGDCREILPNISIAQTIVTDPVWPNSLLKLKGADRPLELFTEAAAFFPRICQRAVVHLGCTSDPRFLLAIPKELPFLRTCWLRLNFPSYRGRILIGSDVAYAFGTAPKSRKGHHLLPGECSTNDTDMDISIKRKRHPCARKLNHLRWLLNVFGEGIILDPFMGSGTTLRAAKDLGFPAIGIEVEEKYCEAAAKRLSQEVFDFAPAQVKEVLR